MTDAGFFVLSRGWMTNAAFKREPFDQRSAWVWLIEHAAFKAKKIAAGGKTINLERGQLSYSIRYLAEAWTWEQTKVLRFLRKLENHNMLCLETATGQSLITICNYDKYQLGAPESATDTQRETQRDRNSDATNKKKRKKESPAPLTPQTETAPRERPKVAAAGEYDFWSADALHETLLEAFASTGHFGGWAEYASRIGFTEEMAEQELQARRAGHGEGKP